MTEHYLSYRNQILHHVHVWQWQNLGGRIHIGDLGNARQRVGSFDVHRTRTTNALTAGSAKGQCGIILVFNLNQSIQHHGTASEKG